MQQGTRCYVNIPIACHSLAMLQTIRRRSATYSLHYSIRGGAAITACNKESFIFYLIVIIITMHAHIIAAHSEHGG